MTVDQCRYTRYVRQQTSVEDIVSCDQTCSYLVNSDCDSIAVWCESVAVILHLLFAVLRSTSRWLLVCKVNDSDLFKTFRIVVPFWYDALPSHGTAWNGLCTAKGEGVPLHKQYKIYLSVLSAMQSNLARATSSRPACKKSSLQVCHQPLTTLPGICMHTLFLTWRSFVRSLGSSYTTFGLVLLDLRCCSTPCSCLHATQSTT